jgi:hypothetical protein
LKQRCKYKVERLAGATDWFQVHGAAQEWTPEVCQRQRMLQTAIHCSTTTQVGTERDLQHRLLILLTASQVRLHPAPATPDFLFAK